MSEERWATHLRCSRSGVCGDLDSTRFLSPAQAPWLVEYDLDADRGRRLLRHLPTRAWSLWRYREVLPVAQPRRRVDLGEGGTPLVPLHHLPPGCPKDIRVWVKDEARNPTGSFKARGLSLAVNRARELGAPGVELPSAGNAALAAAAYAGAAGLPCRVALPEDTPPTIEKRCRELGAEVLECAGTLVDAGMLLKEHPKGYWNLSTLREPYRVEGKKTMGYELAEQFGWSLPDWIVYPTGGGTGLIGMHKAFAELRELSLIGKSVPRMVAVQAAGCAPIVRAFARGDDTAEPWPEPHTEAWGLRVPAAIGDFLILRALRESRGAAVAVAEEEIFGTQKALAARGLEWGPEGSACYAALGRLAVEGRLEPGQRVVLFQTGAGENYR